MIDINSVISDYLTHTETAKKASAAAKAEKELIMQYLAGADSIETTDYMLIVKTVNSARLDTTALYKDFPDIKNDYGKVTTSRELVITAATGVNKASA